MFDTTCLIWLLIYQCSYLFQSLLPSSPVCLLLWYSLALSCMEMLLKELSTSSHISNHLIPQSADAFNGTVSCFWQILIYDQHSCSRRSNICYKITSYPVILGFQASPWRPWSLSTSVIFFFIFQEDFILMLST